MHRRLAAMTLVLSFAACSGTQQGFDYDGDGFDDDVDCAPMDPAIHPTATEDCDDGVDNDCDGRIDGLDRGCHPHVSSADDWVDVDPGAYHSCGLSAGGAVHCWGCGSSDLDYGQCEAPQGEFSQITAGGFHACALRADGGVECWGYDGAQQCRPPDAEFSQISAGNYHTCGVTTAGDVRCWGYDDQDQASPPAGTFKRVAAAGSFSCGVRLDDGIECWGCRDQPGAGSPCEPPQTARTRAAVGHMHACALTVEGVAECWGSDDWDQLSPPDSAFVDLAAGYYHSCGVRSDGVVLCWGCGESGDEADDDICAPVVTSLDRLAASEDHTCGVAGGVAVCWGICAFGECTPP